MIRFDYNGSEIAIAFKHIEMNKRIMKQFMRHPPNGKRRCTLATIFVDNTIMSEGLSACSPEDNFSKVYGRKKALIRALVKCDTSLMERAWEEYAKRCKI